MENKSLEILISKLIVILPLIALLVLIACTGPKKEAPAAKKGPESSVVHPEWSRNANIYEVNIRQYTPEGTFAAFQEHIPRLKKMGVDILWLMPINPVGVKNRKGTLGSYYSISDYKGINKEFGTLDDFKKIVDAAHQEGMKVIIDWVANHTSWDNAWLTEHPDWYKKDSLGNIVSPYDWTDVAPLDFTNKEVWAGMLDAMKYWIREADVDGFRCDVAWAVPIEFWDYARAELDKEKAVFMLAEAEGPQYHTKAFDMTYSWELHHLLNAIAQGKKNVKSMDSLFAKQDTLYPADAYRMLFTSNHDENSWKGTEFERMGEGSICMAVLTATLPGMPLIYSGQESAFNERLKFFEKDTIDWKDYRLDPFYRKLFALKHTYQPLWNGSWGGRMERINTSADSLVFAFIREKEGDKLFVIANLQGKVNEVNLKGDSFAGSYKEWFTEEGASFQKGATLRLKPWEYRVYIRK
jgi:glycosidase